jgi:hypothetical protein
VTLETLVVVSIVVVTVLTLAVAHATIYEVCIWDASRAECISTSHSVLVACNTHILRAVVSLALVGRPESLICIGVACSEAGAHSLVLVTGRACRTTHHAEWCASIKPPIFIIPTGSEVHVCQGLIQTPNVQSLDVASESETQTGVPLCWVPPGLRVGMTKHGATTLNLVAFRSPQVSADLGHVLVRV